jgi:hypothetical protein
MEALRADQWSRLPADFHELRQGFSPTGLGILAILGADVVVVMAFMSDK